MADLIASINNAQLKENAPELRPGDSVRVHAKVVEGNRERIQVFEGVIIRSRKGGVDSDFTVRRLAHGVGVERTFLLHSPRVERIEVLRHGHVRRAQLYYLRGLTGKKARIKEKRFAAVAPALEPTAEAETAAE